MTIFLHAIKLLIKRHSIPLVVSHRVCLQVVGHYKPIAALSHVPLDYGDAEVQQFETSLSHDTIAQYNRNALTLT